MYSVKIDDVFVERWMNNEEYTLFDPKDAPLLADTSGEEFREAYLKYEKLTTIKKKKISARELFDLVLKYRLETGNVYLFFTDNVNKQNLLNHHISQSNLCLTGDTMVTLKIKDEIIYSRLDDVTKFIEENKDTDIYVKSYSIDKDLIEFNKILKWYDQGITNRLYKLTTRCGNSITCTGDHQIFVFDKFNNVCLYKKAIDLFIDKKKISNFNLLVDNKKLTDFTIEEIINVNEKIYDISVEKVENFFANGLLVHNCTEIVLPTEAAKFQSEILDYQNNIVQTYSSEEKIALCNLASINLAPYNDLSEEEKKKLYYDLVRSLDNTIDVAYYPVKAAEIPNKHNRYLGIGVSNLANYLALNKITIDTKESLEKQAELFDEFSYNLIEASMQLAKEKGRADGFNNTKYAIGYYPYKLGNDKAKNLVKYRPDETKWNNLMEKVMKYGMRNCTLMSIAPTACTILETNIQLENDVVKSYKQILMDQEIDYNYIQSHNMIGWHYFKTPFNVKTRYGLKSVNRIWYNGYQPTRTIKFSDNTTFTATYNHKVLVKDIDTNLEKWKYMSDIEINDIMFSTNLEVIDVLDDKEVLSTWDLEVPDVHEYLLENGCVSHNTSAKPLNSTESCDPVFTNGFYYEDMSNVSVKCIVPNFKKNSQYYKPAYDCDPKMLIAGAAVRQLFFDQAQSITIFNTTNPEDPTDFNWLCKSSDRAALLHFYAHSLGIKTLYYLKSKKLTTDEQTCDSCT